MTERRPSVLVLALSALLCLFTAWEVNRPTFGPQSTLAVFAALGLVLCFLRHPLHPKLKDVRALRVVDGLLVLATLFSCGYVVVQTEPLFASWWSSGESLGHRAGLETPLDVAVGIIGLIVVLEATRRSIGWALPLLAAAFLLFAYFGPWFPDWFFPHRGYGVERIVAQTFLHTQGVFGIALSVMFTYVFLFVLFGAVLQATGATQFIIDFAQRLLGNSPGGPAKVAVLSSGLMGSLSGSAVANTATTGTFTIPLMRSSGFRPEIAAGVEAAASSGGALVPPVMGAGAYMMLEIIHPPVTYLQVIRAALIPAVLYYLSLFLVVHFIARKIGAGRAPIAPSRMTFVKFEGLVFAGGFFALIGFLIAGYTVFRAVTLALFIVLLLSALHPRTRLGAARLVEALRQTGADVIPLVSAAACVGIVIGVVTLTGIGTKLPTAIMSVAQGNLVSALFLIMVASIVLGMGLPSAVCYLLMATLVGSVLADLGVAPLAMHLFIFYFGMMSMVTPPVALAAYTAASIAGSGIVATSFAAFRIALVGFTLPYIFVFRPELLLIDDAGTGLPSAFAVVRAVALAIAGIVPFAACIAGFLFARLGGMSRLTLFVAAMLLLLPGSGLTSGAVANVVVDGTGLALFAVVALFNWRARPAQPVLA